MTISSPSAPPDLVKYELLDEIGHGGMATVYRARDVRLGREVAVKVIHPHLRENKEVATRFIAEARAVAKLRHPGIVEVFDVSDPEDKERYLVAELVRGPSLRKLLTEHKGLPPEIGACFGLQLCDALSHAHAAGIVHRDVKPENVLVEVDDARRVGVTKLTDFGIAKVLDAQGVTSTGQVLGSPAHMAPEQIEGGALDVRADVFSLGVLIYECMVGSLPFEGKNPAQVLRKVLDCSYQPADRLRPQVGGRWSRVLSNAIARDPNDRYPEIGKFGEALAAELKELGIEDGAAEIYRFLADPEGYVKSAEPPLVQALIARAQTAQREGRAADAAADLNRAVAYRPDDPELLKMVAGLARGQWRRKALQRGSWVAAALLGAGVAAFLGTRTLRSASPNLPPPTASILPEPSSLPIASMPAPTDSAPQPDTSEVPSAPTPPRLIIPRNHAHAGAKDREIWITANAKKALVSIDGSAPMELGLAGIRQKLSVGTHQLRFTGAKVNPCCEPLTQSVKVEPDDGKGPQKVYVQLRLKDGRLTLSGAPPEGRLSCPSRANLAGDGTVMVKMSRPAEVLDCRLIGNGLNRSETVVLSAGGEYVVRWPTGH